MPRSSKLVKPAEVGLNRAYYSATHSYGKFSVTKEIKDIGSRRVWEFLNDQAADLEGKSQWTVEELAKALKETAGAIQKEIRHLAKYNLIQKRRNNKWSLVQ